MVTNLELLKRDRLVARMLATGATKVEVAKQLGISRAALYIGLKRYQSQALDLVDLNQEEEAAAIQHELDKLEARRTQAERVLNERTEPGTREYSHLLLVIAKQDANLAGLRMDLGLWRKAPVRLLTTGGSALESMDGKELEAYLAELEAKDKELAAALNPRKRAKRRR